MESVAWSKHEGWSKVWFCAAGWINRKNTLTKSSLLPVLKKLKNLTFDSSMNNRFSNSQKFIIGANCNFYCCLIDWNLDLFAFIVTWFFLICHHNFLDIQGVKISASFKEEQKVPIVNSHQAKILWFTLIRQTWRCSLESVDVVHTSEVAFDFPRQQKKMFASRVD